MAGIESLLGSWRHTVHSHPQAQRVGGLLHDQQQCVGWQAAQVRWRLKAEQAVGSSDGRLRGAAAAGGQQQRAARTPEGWREVAVGAGRPGRLVDGQL